MEILVDSSLRKEKNYWDEWFAFHCPDNFMNHKIDVDNYLKRHDTPGDYFYERRDIFLKTLNLIDFESLRGKKILDWACGIGDWTIFCALKGAKLAAGFDISEVAIVKAQLLAEANQVLGNTQFEVASAEDLSIYEDETFDYVIGRAALHHTLKYPKSYKELSRVLKIDGKAVFAESLGHNFIFEILRKIIILKDDMRDAGEGVNLTYSKIYEIGKYFRQTNIYPFNLLFMCKRFFRSHMTKPKIINLLKQIKAFDDYLLLHIPMLKKYCGEVVVEYIK